MIMTLAAHFNMHHTHHAYLPSLVPLLVYLSQHLYFAAPPSVEFLSVPSQHATPTCTDEILHGAHENTVQDQVLPPFVDLSPEFVDLFAGCFDLSHLVTVEIIYLSAGVVDLSAAYYDHFHLVTVGVVHLSAGVVHL